MRDQKSVRNGDTSTAQQIDDVVNRAIREFAPVSREVLIERIRRRESERAASQRDERSTADVPA
jgi:hypothetical protein